MTTTDERGGPPGDPASRIAALVRELHARAAGLWRVRPGHLEQVVFLGGDGLPDAVALAFAEATRSVSLSLDDLGIVRAALIGEPVVSRAADLPEGAGSGKWLRAFGATRSVAVPFKNPSGAVVAILSVALADPSPGDAEVTRRLAGWTEPPA